MKKILIISGGDYEQSKEWIVDKILKQSQDGNGLWDNYIFSTDHNQGSFDAVIKIGRIDTKYEINCNTNNIIALHMEPYLGATYWHDWMVNGNDECCRIVSSYMGDKNGNKQIISQACEPWYVEKTYSELKSMDIPTKKFDDKVSWMTSNQMALPNHWYRMHFKSYVDKYKPDMFDISGSGIKSIDTKWETIYPYKYVMAIENICEPYAWTEKISDVLLGYGLPFYHGCPNISEDLPEESFIAVDIRNPEQAIETMQKAIRDNEWEKRLPAIKEARKRILEQYQFMPYISNLLDEVFEDGEYKDITIKPHTRSSWVKLQEYYGKCIRRIGKRYWYLKNKFV
ncbi:MAG: hypothetical protein ACPG8V_03315 [Alphaproteobacteria bacterium]